MYCRTCHLGAKAGAAHAFGGSPPWKFGARDDPTQTTLEQFP